MENDEIETLGELDRLIKKFAKEATLNIKHDCPIHAENSPSVIEEKVVTSVDAVDGLDRFGVPSRLIKVLKTYHAYVKTEVIVEDSVVAKKQEDAAKSFLKNFERIVSNVDATQMFFGQVCNFFLFKGKKKYLPQVDQYQDLLRRYCGLFGDSFQIGLSHQQTRVLKSEFISLEPHYHECHVKSTAGEIKYARSMLDDKEDDLAADSCNWISNGVWNYNCTTELKGYTNG